MTTLTSEQAQKVNNTGDRIGEMFVEQGVSTSQLRKVYGEIKQAENEFKFEDSPEQAKRTLLLLKPHLAYAAARKENMSVVNKKISNLIDPVIKNNSSEEMELFFRLMEAIVAYHAYYDNKKGDS
ncbi:type III-A CRISPR-associated protein Csm2 [Halocatena marina]|uniref:CRISPR system Cms protein Csm2 n=4 Tax=Halocatena marina TaxID=2934937 RepID=A0ABD5YYM5_9EURY|nr:type III-A CRISPR-associated protein Csm2 [Halocatena marina]